MLSDANGLDQRHLVWRTLENGNPVDFDREPDVTMWQRLKVDMLSLLPLDELL